MYRICEMLHQHDTYGMGVHVHNITCIQIHTWFVMYMICEMLHQHDTYRMCVHVHNITCIQTYTWFVIYMICKMLHQHDTYGMGVHIHNITCIQIMHVVQESKACHASPPEVSWNPLYFMRMYTQSITCRHYITWNVCIYIIFRHYILWMMWNVCMCMTRRHYILWDMCVYITYTYVCFCQITYSTYFYEISLSYM